MYTPSIVLIGASILKMIAPEQFVASINQVDQLSQIIKFSILYSLPIFELSLGLLLLRNASTLICFVASALFLTFLAYHLYGVIASDSIVSCGCFGGIDILNSTLIVIAISLICVISLLIRVRCNIDGNNTIHRGVKNEPI
ncbi:MauE/DoxX family redox-associated membrane protein [Gemmatimonadota bacterium]